MNALPVPEIHADPILRKIVPSMRNEMESARRKNSVERNVATRDMTKAVL
jgi:hypothetical protein